MQIVAAVLLLTCFVFSAPAFPAPPGNEEGVRVTPGAQAVPELLDTTAESAVLMDAASGLVLAAKNPDRELPMASVTKLMTLLLAVEAVEQGRVSLEDRVTATENACRMGGSQIYLEPGEEMSLEELLLAVAVGSANDASVAVAEHISGTVEEFVRAMNERVRQLGLRHTHFTNPTGLPAEGHYTSAYDMAVILREAIRYPLFMRLSSTYEYDLRGGEFKLWNTNKLLKWYRGVDCGKTGWTNEARYCLASSAERDGLRLIVVVLGTPEPRSHFRESIKIYNYGFARYKMQVLADEGEVVKTVPVKKGVKNTVGLVAGERLGVAVPRGSEARVGKEIEAPEEIEAPVEEGQVVGWLTAVEGGRELARVPLVVRDPVPKATVYHHIHRAIEEMYRLK